MPFLRVPAFRLTSGPNSLAAVFTLMLLAAGPLLAQDTGESAAAGNGVPGGFPSVLTHDAGGHVVVRATRITQPIRVDGRLDDAAYSQVAPFTEFIQQEPAEGKPITEKTE